MLKCYNKLHVIKFNEWIANKDWQVPNATGVKCKFSVRGTFDQIGIPLMLQPRTTLRNPASRVELSE